MSFLGETVVAFPGRRPQQVGFSREELTRILDLYGRMVAAGEWRDYAMDFTKDVAVFAAFRRAAERPQARERREAAAREVEHQFGIADRLVFGSQRGARLLAIGQPRLVIAVARACQRQPQDLPVTLDEAFEKLSRLALETRALGAFRQCLFEPFGKLALVSDLRNKARTLRSGLAELNVHEISGIVCNRGRRASRPTHKDDDCD